MGGEGRGGRGMGGDRRGGDGREGHGRGGEGGIRLTYSGQKVSSDKVIYPPLSVPQLVSSGTSHRSNRRMVPHIYPTTGVNTPHETPSERYREISDLGGLTPDLMMPEACSPNSG